MVRRWLQKLMVYLNLMIIHLILLQLLLVELVDRTLVLNYLMTQKKTLSDLDYNIDEVIDELQRNLVKGNISIPDDVKRESFADD